jgi:hypothetical protein
MLQQPPELLNDKERPLLRRSFPICPKCNQTCSKEDGSFVRAFNQVYHVECFVCEVYNNNNNNNKKGEILGD